MKKHQDIYYTTLYIVVSASILLSSISFEIVSFWERLSFMFFVLILSNGFIFMVIWATTEKPPKSNYKVVCKTDCTGDNGFHFKKGNEYVCVEEKGIVSIVKDDLGEPNIFYRKEYKSLFKRIK